MTTVIYVPETPETVEEFVEYVKDFVDYYTSPQRPSGKPRIGVA